jgi:hypothetical protein
MKPLRHILSLGLLALAADLPAATTPAGRTDDLGQGLTYVRPADDDTTSLALLKTVVSGSAVLDLRYFSSRKHTADWSAAIKTFAASNHLCLVLVSPETTPALIEGFATVLPACITIGRASPALNVRIPVDTPAASDRSAWEAIGKGTALDKLLNVTIEKPRYDEAVLAKEHAADLSSTDAPTEGLPASVEKPKIEKKPAVLTDSVLERAVQIHRGLLALRHP